MELLNYIEQNYSYDRKHGKLFYKTQVAQRVKVGDEAGYVHHKGYRHLNVKNKSFMVHRVIWLIENRRWPTGQIDHINGSKTDNRIENLRDASNRENCNNKEMHRSGKLVGASFCKRGRKWISQIRIGKRTIHLGAFNSELEAHNKYISTKNNIERGAA